VRGTFLAQPFAIAHTHAVRQKFTVVASTALVLAALLGVGVALLTTHRPVRAHEVAAGSHSKQTVTFNSNPTLDDKPELYFATPEAAMRYLAAAWNRNDKVALWHVTTPDGRDALDAMHNEAINLRLQKCTRNPAGDYTCEFTHDYPASMHKNGIGHATFIAGPAREHGWYMTVFVGCG
jgi:hypothetical protein